MEPSSNATPETNGPPLPVLPVITMPSVTETKSVEVKPARGKIRFLMILGSIVFLLLVVVLYFWGAYLTNQA